MGKPITVQFANGIQFPPVLGSLILKPASRGKLAYAQNVDSMSDEYGNGVITPGPALNLIANNNKLTGVPWLKQYFRAFPGTDGYIYYVQGLLGSKKAVLNRVMQVVSGQTPQIDTSLAGGLGADISTFFSAHSGHTNTEIVDMVLRPDALGNYFLYIALKDDTDTWVARMDIGNGSLSTTIIAQNNNFTGGFTSQFLVLGSDNNLYWIGKSRVSSIDTSDTYTVFALTNSLPLGTYASCGVDWNTNLVVAYSTDAFGGFDNRLGGGHAGVIIWDYSNANFQKNVPAPCRYISTLVVDPSGNLLCFGGLDEGKTTIYEFTGYGFNPLYSYVGDMPRSRHSVEFDGLGRIVFTTADGQLCRYDRASGIFDHLGSVDTDSDGGGLLAKAIGFPTGNEFIIGSGQGTTYKMEIVSFGSFQPNDPADPTSAPLAVSGIQQLPYGSAIDGITWYIARPLAVGQSVSLLVYVNGNPVPIVYSTMDFAKDKAITSKRETKTLTNVNNFSLGILWNTPTVLTSAPGVLPAEVEFK